MMQQLSCPLRNKSKMSYIFEGGYGLILYSIILFFVSLAFLAIGIAVYKGRTNLIHSYHQENVTDKKGYGKAFGKTLFVFAGAMFASGAVALVGETLAVLSVCILLAGLVAGFVCIGKVQKKYNGGLY